MLSATPKLLSEHQSDTYVFTMKMEILPVSTSNSTAVDTYKDGVEAKPETVNRVCKLLKSQLAFPCGYVVAPDSKFSTVGADSLDTSTICGYLLSIDKYKMTEMIMYPRVDISEITYVTVKKEVNDSVLRWPLRSSGGALIGLLHVHQPAGQNSWNPNT
ncbi:hypothetical protein Tco_1564027 [Tanacetum coccineum]